MNTNGQSDMSVLGVKCAGNIGLVVITLERYFKVVHAVAHRKYYRKWMTRVGVAVPWISGFVTYTIPAYMWTRPVPGQCPRTMAITDKSSRQVCEARTLCISLDIYVWLIRRIKCIS